MQIRPDSKPIITQRSGPSRLLRRAMPSSSHGIRARSIVTRRSEMLAYLFWRP